MSNKIAIGRKLHRILNSNLNTMFRISEQVLGRREDSVARSVEEPDGVLSVTLVEARQLVNRDNTMLGQES